MLSYPYLLALVVLLAVLVVPSQAQTNLLVNGDFETCTSNQTASTLAGTGPVGWFPYAGRVDTGVGLTLLGYHANVGVAGPNYASYSGYCCYDLKAETKTLGITQQVAVAGGTQYVLSFFVMMPNVDTGYTFSATYQFNTDTAATKVLDQTGFPSAAPFWWTQFKYTMTAPSGASLVNITFGGQDNDFGFQLDLVTLYAGALSAAPAGPPALKPNPSNNLLSNGDFESGAMAPWTSTQEIDPYDQFSNDGAYAFLGQPDWGITCPQGKSCMVLGAYTPYTLTTTVSGLTVGTSYQLSFQWVNAGGFNASNPADTGASLSVYANYGTATATTRVWNDGGNSTAAVGSATSPQTATIQLGSATQTSISLAITGQNYASDYIVDMVALTSTSSGPGNGATVRYGAAGVAAAAFSIMTASLLL